MDSSRCRTGVHTYAVLLYCHTVGVEGARACLCACARVRGRRGLLGTTEGTSTSLLPSGSGHARRAPDSPLVLLPYCNHMIGSRSPLQNTDTPGGHKLRSRGGGRELMVEF